MAFFDKLSNFAKNMTDKTNDAMDLRKLNNKISAEQNNITEAYKRLGELYYTLYAQGTVLTEDAAAICREVDTFNRNIAAANQEIETIKAEQEAARAAAQAAAAAKAEHAAQVATPAAAPEAAPAAQEDVTYCFVCGQKLPAGAKFCTQCGAKLN